MASYTPTGSKRTRDPSVQVQLITSDYRVDTVYYKQSAIKYSSLLYKQQIAVPNKLATQFTINKQLEVCCYQEDKNNV